MTDDQYKALISEIKILSTKMRFLEDDVQEIKNIVQQIELRLPEPEEKIGNWKLEKL